jgi:CMP-N,N'-diacetyllegionaminic acid synthase
MPLDMSKVLAVIPARGGSKRLPDKNMRPLAGKPLVGWSIDHALDADIPPKNVVVSSNDQQTLDYVVKHCEAEALHRPEDLSQGVTPPIWNVRHALKWYRGQHEDGKIEFIIYLQPTSPFRRPDDIISALHVAENTGADAVVTVKTLKEVPFEIGFAGRLRLMPKSESGNAIVAPKGAVYLITTKYLDKGGDWWDGITMAHIMPAERSLDIDYKEDFDAAELMAETMLKAGAL